jgi:hypothetical protein
MGPWICSYNGVSAVQRRAAVGTIGILAIVLGATLSAAVASAWGEIGDWSCEYRSEAGKNNNGEYSHGVCIDDD